MAADLIAPAVTLIIIPFSLILMALLVVALRSLYAKKK